MLANFTGWSLKEIKNMDIEDFIFWIQNMQQLEKSRIEHRRERE